MSETINSGNSAFDKAAADVKEFTKKPTNEELLEIYALFKQGTVGDNDTARPGLLDIKGKAKWDAWAAKKGQTKQEAQDAYIAYVGKLSKKYGKNSEL